MFVLNFLCAVLATQPTDPAPAIGTAKGVVYEDKNRNGRREPGERGIAGIVVSNQHQVVRTNSRGEWSLPHGEDTIFFVVKPRDWMTPVDAEQRPRFYYIHKPKGSPRGMRFKGVEPTGPLPASIDFALHRRPEPKSFAALFFGDTQPRDEREVGYVARDIVEPLVKSGETFDFGVTLGDVVFDDLNVFEPLVKTISLLGIPWYYVLGNHDINFDAAQDEHSDETWERHFGPGYYSFDHGPVHFVVLDDVVWVGAENAKKENADRNRGYYRAGLGRKQLEWLRNDLATVPSGKLVVLLMHIPIDEIAEKSELYRLIAERPYALSVSAHTHFQEHRFITEKDGWPKREPHHHVVNVTTCGSWWGGVPDARGVPITPMRDGAPHGYSIFRFDGHQYTIEYRAARRPATYQIHVIAPDQISAEEVRGATFHANVFGGSARSKVEYSFAGGPWKPMAKAEEFDPWYQAAVTQNANNRLPYRPLPPAVKSPHLWKAELDRRVPPGVHPLHVRTTDMFGQTYMATRAVRVR
jgi:3',5'-cyclic AMP phosphodiesterase CpdA